jgi:hypothetical protein
MRPISIHPTLLTVLLLSLGSAARADVNEDAVNRCMYEVGEFGNAMVQTCVEQDIAAAKQLTTYPRAARQTIAHCTEKLQLRGWLTVKMCVDKELEAGAALDAYEKEHASVVQRCQQQLGEQGAVKVKECVDREVGR